jgi:hypothetical protein
MLVINSFEAGSGSSGVWSRLVPDRWVWGESGSVGLVRRGIVDSVEFCYLFLPSRYPLTTG